MGSCCDKKGRDDIDTSYAEKESDHRLAESTSQYQAEKESKVKIEGKNFVCEFHFKI